MLRGVFVCLVAWAGIISAANILYINGVPSPSHFIWHRALIHGLALKGHNLTVLSVDIEDALKPNITYIQVEGVYDALYDDSVGDFGDFFKMEHMSPFQMLKLFNEYTVFGCELALKSKGLETLMEYPDTFGFDLIISDYLNGPCLAAIAHHKFGRPPFITATAFHGLTTTTSMSGAYSYSASVPNHEFNTPQNMNYYQRFRNFLYNHWEELLKQYDMIPTIDKMVRKVVPNIPYVGELEKEARLILLNSNPIIQYSEASMPNVISVGGMQIVKPQVLPEDLKTIVEQAKAGAILFSLGTNVRSDMLGNERIVEILNAMGQLPEYQFLWKFESDSMPIEVPKNVYIRKWMPQNDLLAHSNLKLFITHSGLLSTQEAIWNGVPIIGFPVFADQHQNINYCVEQGVGKRLSLKNVKKNELVNAIREIMTDRSYRDNMSLLSKLFRDQKESALERATWWVEWILRNPSTHILQSNAVRLNWFVKYSYDVIVPLVLIAVIALVVLVKLIRLTLCRKSKVTKNKRE